MARLGIYGEIEEIWGDWENGGDILGVWQRDSPGLALQSGIGRNAAVARSVAADCQSAQRVNRLLVQAAPACDLLDGPTIPVPWWEQCRGAADARTGPIIPQLPPSSPHFLRATVRQCEDGPLRVHA